MVDKSTKGDQSMSRAEIYEKVKALKLNFTSSPQPELLIRVPNEYPGQVEVEHCEPEFTSLCPFNPTQPDYAKITVDLFPDKWNPELKSLKMYFASYRQAEVFHEEIPAMVVNSLYELIEPFYIIVVSEYTPRGGIFTKVKASRVRPGWDAMQPVEANLARFGIKVGQ